MAGRGERGPVVQGRGRKRYGTETRKRDRKALQKIPKSQEKHQAGRDGHNEGSGDSRAGGKRDTELNGGENRKDTT